MTDTRTIRTEGYFGKEKHVTRHEYVTIWGNQAAELMKIGLNVYEEAKVKAGEDWDRLYAQQHQERLSEDIALGDRSFQD